MNNKTKLSHHIQKFLLHKELAENKSKITLANYRGYLDQFCDFCGDVPVKRISNDDIFRFRLFVSERKGKDGQPIKDKSRREYFVALRSFFKFLNEQDVQALPAEKIKIPKHQAPMVQPLHPKQVDLMFKAVNGKDLVSLRNRALLEILYCTGCRISEILNVDREHINLDWGEFVVMGKGRRPRPVFLSQRATNAVLKYLEARRDGFRPLFIDHSSNASARGTGGRLTRRSAACMMREVAKRVKIPRKVTPHLFRHSIATHMLQGGVDIRTIQRFLGHASIRSTELYTHVTDYHLKMTIRNFHATNNLKTT